MVWFGLVWFGLVVVMTDSGFVIPVFVDASHGEVIQQILGVDAHDDHVVDHDDDGSAAGAPHGIRPTAVLAVLRRKNDDGGGTSGGGLGGFGGSPSATASSSAAAPTTTTDGDDDVNVNAVDVDVDRMPTQLVEKFRLPLSQHPICLLYTSPSPRDRG